MTALLALLLAAQPGCQTLYHDTVALTGTVHRRTFPGPPNYESVAKGDVAETSYFLHLDRPLCTRAVPGEAEATRGVTDVQLVLDGAGFARLRPHMGRRAVVFGTLFTADSGHHHTPVLLMAVGLAGRIHPRK